MASEGRRKRPFIIKYILLLWILTLHFSLFFLLVGLFLKFVFIVFSVWIIIFTELFFSCLKFSVFCRKINFGVFFLFLFFILTFYIPYNCFFLRDKDFYKVNRTFQKKRNKNICQNTVIKKFKTRVQIRNF